MPFNHSPLQYLSSTPLFLFETQRTKKPKNLLANPTMSTRLVGDSWLKTHVLGKGAYGTVFLATNAYSQSHPHIAVKSAVISYSSSLEKEKKLLSILDCYPYIIQCFGNQNTIEDGHKFYNLLLEYAPGGSLLDLIKNSDGGKLQESSIQSYTRMILKGLSHIHEKGYVHCDLKPENILVFPSRWGTKLKIADFGLSKKAGKRRMYKNNGKPRYRGTPIYSSPESYLDGLHEAALDIYSLGCIIIVMFTGKPAWNIKNMHDLTEKMVFTYGPEIPRGMSVNGTDFLKKCLVRDHKKRWTAKMLLNHPFMVEDCKPSLSSFTFSHCISEGQYSDWSKLMDNMFEEAEKLKI